MENLKKKRSYYNEWIMRHKKAQDAVPFVQHDLEATEWEIDVLNNIPDEADRIPFPDLSNKLEHEIQFVKEALPMMPEYDKVILWDSTAVTTSISSDIYNYVSKVGDIGTPKTKNYAETYITKYQDIQSVCERQNRVRTLISSLKDKNILNRFDRAYRKYSEAKAGTGERTAAANDIRNLLYGIKGVLFEIARNQDGENMTWIKMANRVAKGGPGSTQHKKVLEQEGNYSDLIDRLSNILKDREGSSSLNLDNIWTQVLDHLFIVLTLANI